MHGIEFWCDTNEKYNCPDMKLPLKSNIITSKTR